MNTTAQPPSLRTPYEKKGRGCFFYGCLTSVVLVTLFAVLAFFAFRGIKSWVLSYTETSPRDLPAVEVTDAEYEALQERLAEFKQALDTGESGRQLVLTEKEINALIARSPEIEEMKGKVYVTIQEDQVRGRISMPLDQVGFRWLEGRYLNGAATFDVALENGVLVVTIDTVEANDKPLPDWFMKEFRKENLAKEMYRDPEVAEAISRFERIRLENGRVIITAAERNAPAEPEPVP